MTHGDTIINPNGVKFKVKSESSTITPVALSKLRCGARSKPFLIKSDLICTPKYKSETF
jgi:hypothetical protein